MMGFPYLSLGPVRINGELMFLAHIYSAAKDKAHFFHEPGVPCTGLSVFPLNKWYHRTEFLPVHFIFSLMYLELSLKKDTNNEI
jgi:hypothetical protein